MRNQKQIVIDIDPEGNCSIEGEGFVGPECSHFMEEIEETLGVRVSQRNKEEYSQRATNLGRDRQRETR